MTQVPAQQDSQKGTRMATRDRCLVQLQSRSPACPAGILPHQAIKLLPTVSAVPGR